jgi:hypothetical protein
MNFKKYLWCIGSALLFWFVTPVQARDITLAWDANSEPNLRGYKIYYKSGLSGEPYGGTDADQGNSPITLPIENLADPNNPEYTLSGLHDNEVYFFRATAYNDQEQESEYSNEAVTFSITLSKGPNLISLCRQPANTDIASVLSPISGKYSSIWVFIDNRWKVYDPLRPVFSELTTLESGRGYWINMNEPATLFINNSTPSGPVVLTTGSNLVGYNFSLPQAVNVALSSIDDKYVSVWAYMDTSWKSYDPGNPGLSDLTTLEPGYGYWISTSQDCTWTLP